MTRTSYTFHRGELKQLSPQICVGCHWTIDLCVCPRSKSDNTDNVDCELPNWKSMPKPFGIDDD